MKRSAKQPPPFARTAVKSPHNMDKCKDRDVCGFCVFESIDQHLLADKAVPVKFSGSKNVVITLNKNVCFEGDRRIPECIEDELGAFIGRSRVHSRQNIS